MVVHLQKKSKHVDWFTCACCVETDCTRLCCAHEIHRTIVEATLASRCLWLTLWPRQCTRDPSLVGFKMTPCFGPLLSDQHLSSVMPPRQMESDRARHVCAHLQTVKGHMAQKGFYRGCRIGMYGAPIYNFSNSIPHQCQNYHRINRKPYKK